MFKVHKYFRMPNITADTYSFKCFPDLSAQRTPEEEDCSGESGYYYDKIEILRRKINFLKKQADLIILAGEKKAKTIVENANTEAANILNLSSIQGYKRGLELANKRTEEMIERLSVKAAEIIQETRNAADAAIDDFERDILEFSLSVADKILNVELKRNDEVIGAIIKNALKKVKGEVSARITVSADNLKRLSRAGLLDSIRECNRDLELSFTADEDMGCQDILVESGKGSIDAGIKSQFLRLKGALHSESV